VENEHLVPLPGLGSDGCQARKSKGVPSKEPAGRFEQTTD